MEGVLVDGEILNEIAKIMCVEREVCELTRKAMEGKLDFETAFKKRLELLKGFNNIRDAARNMPLMPHACEMVKELKDSNHFVAMITGSFDAAAEIIAERLGIDAWASHKLELEDERITGNFELSFKDKADVLNSLKQKLKPDFTAAIGDGANDFNMLNGADIGIAFRAKEMLKGRGFLECEDLKEIMQLFCSKEISILLDNSIHPVSHKLFSIIGNVEVGDLSKKISRDANVVIIRTKTKANKEFIANMPNLKVIATATTGVDHIDIEFAESRGIKVLDAKGDNADAVAEYVIRTIIHATDDVLYTSELLKKTKDFANIKATNKRFELKGKTLGIIGLGNIGSRVKRIAEAFGMIVKAYDPYKEDARHTLKESLECDFITLHAELTEETRGMIGKEEINVIKKNAIFINTARAEIVDENALADALRGGRIKKAIIDVFRNEPKPSALYELPNVICTPHIAGNSEEAKLRAAKTVFIKVAQEYMKRRSIEVAI